MAGAVIGFVIGSVFSVGNASLNSGYMEELNSTVHLCALYNRTVLEDKTATTGYYITVWCQNKASFDFGSGSKLDKPLK